MNDLIYSRYLKRFGTSVPKLNWTDASLFQIIIQGVDFSVPKTTSLLLFHRKSLVRFLQVKALMIHSHLPYFFKRDWFKYAHLILGYSDSTTNDVAQLLGGIDSADSDDLYTMCNELTDCILSDWDGDPCLLIRCQDDDFEIPF